jgi:hypothetical protein
MCDLTYKHAYKNYTAKESMKLVYLFSGLVKISPHLFENLARMNFLNARELGLNGEKPEEYENSVKN